MLLCCPHCGSTLRDAIKDGIGSCLHCGRVFDTCPLNRLLSACWYVRNNHIGDIDMLVHHGIRQEEAYIAVALSFEGCYSHDEIQKILEKLGISKNYVE